MNSFPTNESMWDKNKNKRIWYPYPESHSTGRAPFCSKSFILQEELGPSHFSKRLLDFYFISYYICATFTWFVMGKGWRQVCIQRWLKEKDDIEMKTFIGLIILTNFIIRMKMFYNYGAKVKNLQHKMVSTQFSKYLSITFWLWKCK